MESSVETLKCKSCGVSLDSPGDAAALRCSRCGQPLDAQRSSALPVASGVLDPLRDFVLRIYCRVTIVLILYVLSTGPMYWAVYEAFNTNGSSFLAQLYYPIAFACQYNDTICTWFDWYVGLWVY